MKDPQRTIEGKRSNKPKKQEPTATEILMKTQLQFHEYVEKVSDKLSTRMQTSKGEFMLAFQRHLNKIERELKLIREKNEAHDKNFSADEAIKSLTKQTALFRQQAMRLSNQLQDTTDQLNLFMRRTGMAQKEIKQKEEKIKQLMFNHKNLAAEVERLRRVIFQQKGEVDRLKTEILKEKSVTHSQPQAMKTIESLTANFAREGTIIRSQKQTKFGNNTSTSSLQKRLFTYRKIRLYDSMQGDTTPRNSNKRGVSKSSVGYHMKTEQSPKHISYDKTKYQAHHQKATPSEGNIQFEEDFIGRFKREILKARDKLLARTDETQIKKFRSLQNLLMDDQCVEHMVYLFSERNSLKIPLALISADIMMKINGALLDPFDISGAVKWSNKSIKKEKFFKHKNQRILTSRANPTAQTQQQF